MRVLAVTNLYPTSRSPAMGTFVEQQVLGLRRSGLDVEVMLVNRSEGGMGSYFTMGAELRSRIERFQPDVVHAMYGGVLAERMTRIVKDRPTVVSFCGSDLLGELLSGPMRRVISEYGILASYIAARRAVGIVVKSRNLEEALPATVDRSKVRIIPNGVDLERFRPLDQVDCRNRLGWDSDKFHVLFPTNAGDPRKRLYLAQAAVDNANRSGLNAEMHQLQGVRHEAVPIWLNASNVVLLTSLHEGSPNVIKEALACDIPVVSVDVGDVSERVEGIEGCYIARPDAGDLGVKLGLVRTRGGRIRGRERMQALSLEQTALHLGSLYHEVVQSHKKQSVGSGTMIHPSLLVHYCLSLLTRKSNFSGQSKRH
ncbi:MAG: glycosyltransferase [Nitrospira sp.]|nr:glycosyltransferase [Nitrospira sp.]